jgi:hypothetical protein
LKSFLDDSEAISGVFKVAWTLSVGEAIEIADSCFLRLGAGVSEVASCLKSEVIGGGATWCGASAGKSRPSKADATVCSEEISAISMLGVAVPFDSIVIADRIKLIYWRSTPTELLFMGIQLLISIL